MSGAAEPARTLAEATVREPRPGVFTGCYDSTYGAMLLLENADSTAVGAYVRGDGELSGQIRGEALVFRWHERETGTSGSGYFLPRADGVHLSGRWGYGDSFDDGGPWLAEKYSSDVESCR